MGRAWGPRASFTVVFPPCPQPPCHTHTAAQGSPSTPLSERNRSPEQLINSRALQLAPTAALQAHLAPEAPGQRPASRRPKLVPGACGPACSLPAYGSGNWTSQSRSCAGARCLAGCTIGKLNPSLLKGGRALNAGSLPIERELRTLRTSPLPAPPQSKVTPKPTIFHITYRK